MKTQRQKKNLFFVIIAGVVLAAVSLLAMGANSLRNAKDLAKGTTQMLVQQCQSFDSIQSVTRVGSLFAMNENLSSLNSSFLRDPSTVNDEFLENYVDGMQLSGVAVLDGDLRLVASGYTRDKRKDNWKDDFYPGLFERMVHSKTQVFAQRFTINGQYYDVCATARKDADGVIIAYYEQPMSLIYDTENDLKQLLKNVRMDLNGEFIITHNERFISEGSAFAAPSAFVENANKQLTSDDVKRISTENGYYYGMRVVEGDYSIYVYFPEFSVFRDTFAGLCIVVLLYSSFCLAAFVYKSHAENIKQRMLDESNKKLTESASIMQSLETIYYTVFYVDLKCDTYQSIIMAPWVKDIIDEKGVYSYASNELIERACLPAHRERLKERLSFSCVREQLSKGDEQEVASSYYTDYEVDRQGKAVWCRVTLTAVDYDEEKKPERVLVMLQDVDAEKSKEVEYQEKIIKEADLAQAANRAKSTFLFNVSHDIRTPMNAILGYSDLAKKDLNDSAKLSKYLTNIQISGERMLSLINEVLELARIENGKITVNELAARAGDGIRSCLIIIAPSAKEKNITVRLNAEFIEPYVFVDHSHMARIILNLLNNAIKFTQNGGQIDCDVRHVKGDEPDYVITEVAIRDNGIGISKAFLPHIFDVFERERNSTVSGIAGTGLGLGIAKKLADLMGGSITVESEEGKGSTFTVRVPMKIATEEDVKAVGVKYRVKKESVGGKRVLIAEDGDMNAEILAEIIEGEGIKTERACDGDECLKMIREAPEGYYDLVLMDIQMPKTDGFAATDVIRRNANAKKANIPIVDMTANAFPEDRQRSLEAGMNAHLSKPINTTELMLIFEKYLGAELVFVEYEKSAGGGV